MTAESSSASPTHAHRADVVARYVDGFERSDAAAIAALYAETATLEDPVGSEVRRGITAIAEFYERAVAGGSKLRLEGPVRTAGEYAAFPFSVAVGPDTRLFVIDTFRFDDEGKIIEMRAFWGPDNLA